MIKEEADPQKPQQRERAIGIVLSAIGSDATRGVRAIKAKGCRDMAQKMSAIATTERAIEGGTP